MSPIFQSSLHSLFTPWAEVERHRFYTNLENFWPNCSQKCHSGIIFATEGPDKHDHFQPGESYSITLRQIPSNFKVFPSLISTSCLNTIRVWSCLEKWVEFWAPKNLQNPCQIFNRTSALKSKSHFSEKSIFLFFVYFLFIFSQVTRKTKPEIKRELQD